MTFDERGRIWITESLEYPRQRAGPGPRSGQGPRGHRRRRQGRQVHGLRRRPEHPLGHRRRPRRRLGRQLARHPLPPGHRRRRQGRHARGRRHRLRPRRHPRAAQLADLGARRLALRLERRVQPQPGRLDERQDVRVHLRDLPHPSQDPRLRGLLRGDEQPLGHRLRPRGRVLRQRLRDRPPLAPGRDRLLPSARAGPIRRSPGRSSRSSTTSTRRPPIAASTTSTATPIPPEYRGRLYMGNIHGNCINVDVLERNGSTYAAEAEPDFLAANDAWFMPVVAEDRPRRLPLHPRLVRPLSLLPGRQPRPRRHRPAQGPALPRPLRGHAAARRASTWRRRATTS